MPREPRVHRLKFSDFGGLARIYAPGLDYGMETEKALEIQQFRADLLVRPLPVERATVTVYSHMVKCKVSQATQPDWLRGVVRGAIGAEFRGKKRKRLFDKFNSWRMPGHHGRFVTLTYPDEFPLDWRHWKSDLEKYRRALLARYPDAQAIWRLELQKRGAPHYHIVLYTHAGDKVKAFRRWNDAVWAKIAHSHDVYHGKYACKVETIWSRGQAIAYLGKYCGKAADAPVTDDGVILDADDLGSTTGRQWGTIGKLDCRPYAQASLPVKLTGVVRRQFAVWGDNLEKRWAAALWSSPDIQSWTMYGMGETPTRDTRIPGVDPPPASAMLLQYAGMAQDRGVWGALLDFDLSRARVWDKLPSPTDVRSK